MSRAKKYAVDPSLQSSTSLAHPWPAQRQGYTAQPGGQVEDVYRPDTGPRERSYHSDLPPRPASGPSVSVADQHHHSATPAWEPPVNSIPQPPHSAGPHLRGPKPKIDASQVPSPIEAAELDQNLYDQEDFESCNTKGLVPLAGTDYRGVDQGNSLPRYMRPTLTHIPSSSSLLDTSQLPFGVILQPFAPARYDEEPIPLVEEFAEEADTQETVSTPGPPRCIQCRGYINPWCKWVDGGQRWQCNLCQAFNLVDSAYFCHLDMSGVRTDVAQRAELRFGTVDFAVPSAYWAENPSSVSDSAGLSSTGDLLASLNQAVANTTGTGPSADAKEKSQQQRDRVRIDTKLRRPLPIGRIFALDVSWNAAKSGILTKCCQCIKDALYGRVDSGDEEDGSLPAGRVAIVTFDRAVHYYDLSPDRERPHVMVVTDLEDSFVPLANGLLVDPRQSRRQIESLLDLLPTMYAENASGDIAVGAMLRGGLEALSKEGGQINVFLSGLPNAGPGKLKPREDPLIYGTDKEKTLYIASDPFWRNTAEKMAEAGVGVNMFMFPERYMDIASVATMAGITGGSIFFHPRFDAHRDTPRLREELSRLLASDVVYNCALRLRCSNGLRVRDYTGNFHQRSLTDVEIGNLSGQSCILASVRQDKKLDDRQLAFLQTAVLYTTAAGHRRVRVMNLSLPITSHIGNLFRFADFDACIVQTLREAIIQTSQRSLVDIRRYLTERCVKVLLMYRKHCAAATQPGQLILPEAFKLLPLMTLCMLKCKAIKGGNVASDVRALYMRNLRSMPLTKTSMFLYPRMFALHNMAESTGFPASNGRLNHPTYMRTSYAYMVADGAYLMANGEIAVIWIGAAVSPQIVRDLFAVDSADELDARKTGIPVLETLLSAQVRNLLSHFERLLGHALPVVIARQNVDGTELEFANMLVEDANNDAFSYTEYLMSVHRAITDELNGVKSSGEGWKAPWS